MRKVLKFFFVTVFFVSIFIFLLPWLVDKQKVLELLNEKIETEFNLNISYDEDINLSFFPFPTLKINSLVYFDKKSGIDLSIKKLNLSSSWRSIINFNPEIVSLEVFSPYLKFSQNKIVTDNSKLKINVNSLKTNNLEKLKSFKEKIELIKIYEGIINLNQKENLVFNDLNFTLRGKEDFVGSGEFELKKYYSKIKFDFNGKNFDDLNFIIQQKIKDRNKIDYNGKLLISQNGFEIFGKAKSKFLSLEEFIFMSGQLINLKNSKIYFTNNLSTNLKVNFDFNINEIALKKFSIKENVFNLIIDKGNILIKKFSGKMKNNSVIRIDSIYYVEKKKLNGLINFSNFMIDKKLFGSTDFDLYDGLADCSINFSTTTKSLDFENVINNLDSRGFCSVGKIKLSGIDLKKAAKRVDEINDLSALLSFLKFKNFQGNSMLDSIKLNFFTKNAFFQIKELVAKHENLEISSVGNYQMISDKLILNSDAKFKTKKYSNLPPLGIDMNGTLKNYKISYDFEKLKERLFNEGINKILKEKKSIVIDPGSLKDFLKKGKINNDINPNEILDLFLD